MNLSIPRQDAEFIIEPLGQSIKKLEGKRLLIAGASGFFGTTLLESVALLNDARLKAPCKITAVSLNNNRLSKSAPHLLSRPDINFINCDVRAYKFPAEPFDYVIHAASPVDLKMTNVDRIEMSDIIVNGTKQILSESVKQRAGKFLFISSGAVYGFQPSNIRHIREDWAGAPDITRSVSLYGEAKRLAETLCRNFAQQFNFDIVTVRPFTFVGPYQDINSGFAVTQFIKSGLKKEPLIIEGDGTTVRSYCYSADLAIALWKILLEAESGSVYNIGSENEISITDLAREILTIMELDLKIEFKQRPQQKHKPMRYIPSISRMKSDFGFKPKFGLKEALSRTIEWFRNTV